MVDKRKKYICVLDTETTNGIMVENKLDLSQSIVYDIGYQIIDKKENVYVRRSFTIYEIFVGMKDLMQSAYYKEKIPAYWEDIKNNNRTLATFFTIWKTFKEDMKMYNCNTVSAHNAYFDLNALNNTVRYLTKSKYRYFFDYDTVIWDTLKMSRQTYLKEKGYLNFCKENDYMTKHATPRPKATAEVLYRYISGDYDFIEEHQGLADVEIESQLLVALLRKHKKMTKTLF